ncbi:ChaN family lipoprotein [Guyparkeria hydrothermalis]|uniref:ChaN family lipoprotein n=1 Tax=Guyparkeria hydrothermalis TaxID=923 RepID=UPI0020216190|nr:ChaN family lipoprotein [Guyparkeria hydrothermalis]MCL7743968.1 ChaN family lipoprotein [Guyparkeria hydrothermalis]
MKQVHDRRMTAIARQDRSGFLRGLTHWLAGFVLATLLGGCAATGTPAVEVGTWLDRNGDAVHEATVLDRIQAADVVLLGEVHDSAAVHRQQLTMLRALDRPIVLALEQLDLGVPGSPDVMNVDLDAIGPKQRAKQGGFDFEGWGWKHYGGLFEQATARQWPLWPLNLPRRKALAVAMAGEEAWQDQLQTQEVEAIERFGPGLALPEIHQANLVEDLQQAHCGRIDAESARGLARAQVARDMLMADALLKAHRDYPEHLVVGVMGNQHARLDRGAGFWLQRSAGNRQGVVAIGMLPIDSVETPAQAAPAYDFVWITEPVDRDVGCESGS